MAEETTKERPCMETGARAQDIIVLYNLLRQEIDAIEMALEAVRLYVKGEGHDDYITQEALSKAEDRIGAIRESVERVWRVHIRSKGEQ